ncbi:hypothetical protein EV207_13429 [Scopulibacillus darangshiensis]|uniref:Uncharacterized protein n=1 Tax=Scopulibacillus darangshiensis TaxID=442528 RepID=A0A4R2NM65_9BACL|nr:hypothetical protein [Scopulibacillus darangshiensis]TCP22687.1 hypothetical protein EV207_13429 [Scopulibacillus darangshiensis]
MNMHVVSSFDHTIYLELVITALEEKGIEKDNILAIPLNKRTKERKLFDTIHKSDGVSVFDLGAALAVVFTVFGSSYGFIAEWGPILWGLIGAGFGFTVGFIIDILINKAKKKHEIKKGKSTEVFVVVSCNDANQVEIVERLLWEHFALGVTKLGG